MLAGEPRRIRTVNGLPDDFGESKPILATLPYLPLAGFNATQYGYPNTYVIGPPVEQYIDRTTQRRPWIENHMTSSPVSFDDGRDQDARR
jgi:hypothetical protein